MYVFTLHTFIRMYSKYVRKVRSFGITLGPSSDRIITSIFPEQSQSLIIPTIINRMKKSKNSAVAAILMHMCMYNRTSRRKLTHSPVMLPHKRSAKVQTSDDNKSCYDSLQSGLAITAAHVGIQFQHNK